VMMMQSACVLVVCLLLAVPSLGQKYTLVDHWEGANFLGNFDFWAAHDPTNGYVKYVSQADANSLGLLNVTDTTVNIYSEHTKLFDPPGRPSVRITSKKTFNGGLFVLDLSHMPFGCGNWPAFWTCGPNWPNYGEIDIIEGVNNQVLNSISMHTSSGCTMQGTTRKMSGVAKSMDCWIKDANQTNNSGCGVQSANPNSFGAGFNSNNGGIYAMEWSSAGIFVWYFSRAMIPQDLTGPTPTPNPSMWALPDAAFPFGANCPSTHFANHQIIFDNTFCGEWAGAVYASMGCPVTSSTPCNSYVRANFTAFVQAFWSINYLNIFQTA